MFDLFVVFYCSFGVCFGGFVCGVCACGMLFEIELLVCFLTVGCRCVFLLILRVLFCLTV